MHGQRKRAPKENTSFPISLRASLSRPQTQTPRSVVLTATSPSTASISTCSTLMRVDKDDVPSACELSVGKVTAEEKDCDEFLKRITNDEQYDGDGGDSDVDGDEYDIHRNFIVS